MMLITKETFTSSYWDTLQESRQLALHATIYTGAAELMQPGWVLDLGCEYGFGSLLVAETNPSLQVIGLDLNFTFLRYSLGMANMEQIPRLNASGSCLPILSGSLTGIYLINLLHLVKDPSEVVAEAWRTLKPGGVAIVSIPMDGSRQSKRDTPALVMNLQHELHAYFSQVIYPEKISGQLPFQTPQTFLLDQPTSPWIAFCRKN